LHREKNESLSDITFYVAMSFFYICVVLHDFW